jgi:hypothetical protein
MKNRLLQNCCYFFVLLTVFFIFSCSKSGKEQTIVSNELFELADFEPVSNFESDSSGVVNLFMDYTGSLQNGFVIPSKAQSPNGYFAVKFKIKNKTNTTQDFGYKIFYNNETYKFTEVLNGKENPFAGENFYGSWEDLGQKYHIIKSVSANSDFVEVEDSIRILGNPRNELRYFENNQNQRWKRNPRVGFYSFHILIFPLKNKEEIPEYVLDIAKPINGSFKNPFAFLNSAKITESKNLICFSRKSILKLSAKPEISNGIYINPMNFSNEKFASYYSEVCGQDEKLYSNAAFEQFINNVDPSMRFENVPVVRDIMGDDYTKTDYNWDKAFYRREELISVLPGVARIPCESVYIDDTGTKIVLKNPGCVQGKWRKESVGIRTRHGFSYGKYRLKCKLTQLLNKNNVWNGLTNAIWLLSQQGSGAWNSRRSCDKEGYMATYWGGDNDKRVPVIDYSEIDFEILKTPPYCPPFGFPPVIKNPVNDRYNTDRWNVEFPEELEKNDGMISVACTNWDMACKQPLDFKSGCNSIVYEDKTFDSHRWTDNYRALTQKHYESDDELFGGEFYYFEIDWRPTEIIWRIGPSPGKMKIVGYMNDQVTSIPNNQMTLIVTQEYHNTKWWPGSPYMQENLPFPSKDLIGEIYELIIE